MPASFFFYDLETSGFDARNARIVQFGGQRTDMNLKPTGEPVNVIIKLSADVVPDPNAVLVTGITPQQTLAEGVSEAEFLRFFYEEVVKPDTIFVGFNSIRFDDKFMQFLNYRNFYDAYEWRWANGSSQWDLLDVVRMTRALRPEGIEWPFAPDGKATNRLEFLTKVNKLDHSNAHDALSDVNATIALAKLIKTKQPDLFNYLLKNRTKKNVAALVEAGEPFAYTSGRYPSESLHTTAVVLLTKHPDQGDGLVYDLRHDPTIFLKMSVAELAAAWQYTKDPDAVRLPVKTMKYNHCPAVAPLGVLSDKASSERIKLNAKTINQNLKLLNAQRSEFAKKIREMVVMLDAERAKAQIALLDDPLSVDTRLYDGFFGSDDKQTMRAVRAATPEEIVSFKDNLRDPRLKNLLPLYKARNYPASLNSEERVEWDSFCRSKLFDGGQSSRLAKYFGRLQELSGGKPSPAQEYLLEELRLYGQSIMPAEIDG